MAGELAFCTMNPYSGAAAAYDLDMSDQRKAQRLAESGEQLHGAICSTLMQDFQGLELQDVVMITNPRTGKREPVPVKREAASLIEVMGKGIRDGMRWIGINVFDCDPGNGTKPLSYSSPVAPGS